MRTARDVLHDYQLLTPEALTAEQLLKRVAALAEFAAAYDASYSALSLRLQRQTKRLKAAEDTAVDLAAAAVALRALFAAWTATASATVAWYDARGTEQEPAALAAVGAALATLKRPAD